MKNATLLLGAALLLALSNPVEAGGLFGKKKKSCATEQAKCGDAKATTTSAAGTTASESKSGCAASKAAGKGCCSKKGAASASTPAPTM
jgi:hypothetical protein